MSENLRKVKVYFDGNRTPEGVTCSYVLIDEKTGTKKEQTINLPKTTTVPEAEYQGLICALKAFKKTDNIQLEIFGDSELVIKQIQGVWECKKPHLRILRSELRNLLNKFSSYQIKWLPREENLAR
ncbi:MAG: ribonuclease HI family protein [Elusimicrobiota bacterium]|nr:ribonuclease HI family protein [Elusimicrobiota bacterium]